MFFQQRQGYWRRESVRIIWQKISTKGRGHGFQKLVERIPVVQHVTFIQINKSVVLWNSHTLLICSLNSGGLLANLIIQQAIYVSKFLGLLEHLLVLKDTLYAKHWLDIFHILYFGTEKKINVIKLSVWSVRAQVPSKNCGKILSCFFHSWRS